MADDYRGMLDADRLIHEPARLVITTILYTVEGAASHLAKLEEAGYVVIEKRFEGKTPRTLCRLTEAGRAAFEDYRQRLKRAADSLSGLG